MALAVLAFSGESDPADLRTSEATRIFDSLQNYLTDALTGAFQDGREESSPEYQLAEDLRRRGRNVSRYRLYLLTDRALSARAKDLPNADLAGIPVSTTSGTSPASTCCTRPTAAARSHDRPDPLGR